MFLGDGIGAEVAESVKTIFKHDNVPVEWEQVDVTGVQTGKTNPEELFRESVLSLKRNKVGLKGETNPSPAAIHSVCVRTMGSYDDKEHCARIYKPSSSNALHGDRLLQFTGVMRMKFNLIIPIYGHMLCLR